MFQTIKNYYHLIQAIAAVGYYGNPAKQLVVIGVTGTDGKTTTSTLIYHILQTAGYKVALISTVAAYVGDKQIDTGFHVTSPSPWSLQRLLRQIADQGLTHVVLESTSHGLDQHRLYGTNIQIAVVTNITHEHMDYHKTYDRYVAAKAKIFQSAKTAIINQDDTSCEKLIPFIPKNCKVISYSQKKQAVKYICDRFPETYNQSNAVAAEVVARTLRIDPKKIETAITSFSGVPGRMQHIKNNRGITAIVDFAHTPNALKEALTAVRTSTKGKVIVIFGAAGARDVSKRPMMGKIASELADEVIVTAEDPRHEDVRLIIHQIKAGITRNQGHIHAVADRKEAIRFGVSLAKKGDTVIVCGKGHEQSINLDGIHELPWSDITVMTDVLKTAILV